MERVELRPTGRRPVVFEGELIAESRTAWDQANWRWSGSTGRQERVRVWRTASGRFVVEHLRQTQWVGERDTTAVLVFDSVGDLVGWIEQRHRIIADELLEALRRQDLIEPERIE